MAWVGGMINLPSKWIGGPLLPTSLWEEEHIKLESLKESPIFFKLN